ncbi:copper homeostasis protein CutC [Salinicoccus halitifaciens]|uniref:PF03932 family protein CutC n=1 Tax=Salinicoccus halitifaciens TaxID=1073415 RepID=A0ABV2EAS3_9STAP|nr:copper homeostasis protein CutC [Salinicoccus halitifaciens]MCD2137641.1 copper homeostasis protein CutC [Salinicoccus halitifaciens]
MLEVIATNLQDVIDANQYGADRIELCVNMHEGGLTPSIGLVEEAAKLSKIPVHVMVRSHDHGFVYNALDQQVMLSDIKHIKETNAAGIVIGALTYEGVVDEYFLKKAIQRAEGLDITFHRAFDSARIQFEALQTLMKYDAVKTILSSGGEGEAADNLPLLIELNKVAREHGKVIMPGGGININNVRKIKDEFDYIHVGSGVRLDGTFRTGLSQRLVHSFL